MMNEGFDPNREFDPKLYTRETLLAVMMAEHGAKSWTAKKLMRKLDLPPAYRSRVYGTLRHMYQAGLLKPSKFQAPGHFRLAISKANKAGVAIRR